MSPDGREFFSYASSGIRDIYELTPDQVSRHVGAIHARIHPDDFAAYRASLAVSAKELTPWHLEYRVMLPRQGVRWRQGDARPQRLRDGIILWHGFITDATERKLIEAELQQHASVDFLTQLPNRRHFTGCMEEELARLRRHSRSCAVVMMCDLDHFKTVNDRFGHAMGDKALRHFASILRHELRKSDIAGRVGGEEFAILLSGTNLDEANIFAARVQRRLAETPLIEDGVHIALTVSIGITAMQAGDAGAELSISRSDAALYRAKENGRDRIEFY